MERSNPVSSPPAEGAPRRPAPKPHSPGARQVVVVLIQEELKNRKLFEELRWLSYHNSFLRVDLVDLIMQAIGMDTRSSIHRSLCHTLLDQHSQRVVASTRELRDEATRVYDSLLKHAIQAHHRNAPQPPSL